jgi:hypothetical protein
MGSESSEATTATAAATAAARTGTDKATAPGAAAAEAGSPLDERTEFKIECLKNARYHEDREAFFSRLHKATMLVAVLGGTASFAFVKQFMIFARW